MNRIFCLETEWDQSMHDLKKKSTVLPLLDFLENAINIEYTFRQVATESDFNYYIDHLQQPSYNAYDLIYLCFHGQKKCICFADKTDLALMAFAEKEENLGIFRMWKIETTAESIQGIATHYGVRGKLLCAQYKDHFSDFWLWEQLEHASEYLIFPENMGPHLSIDETCLSSGEVYTFLTNKDGHGGPGTIVAVVHGTKAENVITVIETISRKKRLRVEEITLDLSSSMMLIARTVFPKARITNDRFHVQKIYYEAVDDLRISLRWMVRDLENEEMRKCRKEDIRYIPFRHANGDTRKQLLARAKFILTKHESKWTPSQRWRADIIFEFYPELKEAYGLAMELTDIFNTKCVKDVARTKLAKWFNKVEQLSGDAFRTVIDTFTNHYETILNYFVNRQTNAGAESFNAKVKAFRSQFRGVADIPFFLFRLTKLCA